MKKFSLVSKMLYWVFFSIRAAAQEHVRLIFITEGKTMNVKTMKRSVSYIILASTLLVSLLLAGAWPSASEAQTPDGATPANEGICDELMTDGVTPGLYGLCIAYCEAQDCPDPSVGPDQPSAQCSAPDPAVLEAYNRKKTDADPAMPCICPCWTAQEIGAIGFTWSPHEVDFFPNDFSPYYIRHSLVEINASTDFGAYQYADVWYFPNQQPAAQCIYAYYDSRNPATPIVRSQEISEHQADACKAEIDAQLELLITSGVRVVCLGNLCRQCRDGHR